MDRVVAVTGGKGGTGKSFIAVNLSYLLGREEWHVLADLDVEAPNDHLLLGLPRLGPREDVAIFLPLIDYPKCTACGACAKVCDTGAIIMARGRPPVVMPRLCSGCKACLYVCPYDAIRRGARVLGYMYKTPVERDGSRFLLVTGELHYGEEHTAPLVRRVKDESLRIARERGAPLIVDTGAGTGNSISIALQWARLVIAVTEPTPLGLHDLRAILEIAAGMGIPVWVVINRAGIGPDGEHERLARRYGAELVHRVPYAREAVESYVRGVPVTAYAPESGVARSILELYEHLRGALGVS